MAMMAWALWFVLSAKPAPDSVKPAAWERAPSQIAGSTAERYVFPRIYLAEEEG
jgi:hypothetical protein